MSVTRLLSVAALAVAGFAQAAAQQAAGCSLKVEQAPQLRGLRLGMATSELAARYPRLTALRADELGQAKATFGGLRDVDEVAFQGVEAVNVNFVDDRLVEFRVHYGGAPWDSMEQFLSQLNESLKLPAVWAGGGKGDGYGMRTLSCEGFQVQAAPSSYSAHWLAPWVSVRQQGADDVVERRAAEKRERQRRAFRP